MQTMVWAGPICTDKKILEAGPRQAAFTPLGMSICFPGVLKIRGNKPERIGMDGIHYPKIDNLDIVFIDYFYSKDGIRISKMRLRMVSKLLI
ncbi:hypothetical protein IPU70_22455 [Achromobacter sp. SD115]|uniref:hypothetical protein n=1 Tax=Achromobacter sp. SD115 TaxID=2782011 RepID=UPI001A967A9C|nr:hypothetical protein [Achromobacter sp. SD115]MBO1016344.1 hypothetical protein [Achromobacter sp. SD115]